MTETMKQRTFTPRETVSELDRYIVGQKQAKRAVAVALRNRWRRQQVPEEMRDDIIPKNILMIGPTGVGKTEIARRLAKLVKAPFIKVEASKFTEVGYVGRDVESMVRDLTEVAVGLAREEQEAHLKVKAEANTEDRILDILLPRASGSGTMGFETRADGGDTKTRESFRRMLREGTLDDREVEIEVSAKPATSFIQNFGSDGVQDMVVQLQDLMGRAGPKKRRKATVQEAREIIMQEELDRLVDPEAINREGVELAQNSGIIFIDEIDKVAARTEGRGGPDVSREGVQRDLLPIVEGSTVTTKYGRVRTDHVLFVAAGAFHTAKPSDLIPELQGRFPIRVELESLGADDFVRILDEPKNSLLRQYTALLQTEGVELVVEPEAIRALASIAAEVNERIENIGARRLHTVLETLLEEISFDAPERRGHQFEVSAELVREKLQPVLQRDDLSRFVL